MQPSWLYQQSSIAVVAALFAAMALAGEIGCRLGRRWYPRVDDLRRGHLGSVLGSLLGLLALLVSFTFAMSVARYDARRQLVVADADALAALHRQSSRLQEEPRHAFKKLLHEYVNHRVQLHLALADVATEKDGRRASRSEQIEDQMWQVIQRAAELQPPAPGAEAMYKGVIDAALIHLQRLQAHESRVPDPVIWLLLFGALTAMTAVGLAGGLGNHQGLPARLSVSVLLCATIFVLLDLDKPLRGIIQVSQAPMLHLRQVLDRDPEAGS